MGGTVEPVKAKDLKLALCFNAFVFPGAGYFFVKQKVKGVIVISIVLLLFVIAARAYASAFETALLHGSGIVASLAGAWNFSAKPILLAFAGIVAIWIVSIVDVCRQKPSAAG